MSKFTQNLLIALGPGVFLIMLWVGGPASMTTTSWMALACTVWIAIWWVTEAVPIPVTSLLPLVLFPLTGVMDMGKTALPYAKPIIFLFLGGFIIALAMERWNLHKRIALSIISIVGTDMKQILLGFILATGLLSMWISNTATTLMMLPIALSVIGQFQDFAANSPGKEDDKNAQIFAKALVLSIAYAASIGGMATLVGTPTNLIFFDSVEAIYGVEIGFDQWFKFGFPISMLLLGVCWWHMSHYAFNLKKANVSGSGAVIREEVKKLGPMRIEEKWVLAIFSIVALAWMVRRYVITPFFPSINDTTIVLIGAVILFVIPSRSEPGARLMDWKTSLRVPWGVLLLFGGAFAVAAGFQESGLTGWIGDQLAALKGVPLWTVMLTTATSVNFLTEITQNVGTCTLMMPIMSALAGAIEAHPFALMATTCIAASCAFMLPVATAPNAIVFGSGFIKMKDMVRAGFLLNILSIIVIFLAAYFLLPLIWGIDIGVFPEELRK